MNIPGKIGIVGGGTWATALAKIVLETQDRISWCLRTSNHVREFLQHGHNPTYLSDVAFDIGRIDFFEESNVNDFLRSCDTIILAVPSPYVKSYLKRMRNSVLRGKLVINAIKGMVPDDNLLISEYLQREKGLPREQIGVVSGPCHAEEIAQERRSYLTVGCFDISKAEAMSRAFTNRYVHCSVSRDVIGIEYASVLKNIYAIAAGICNGLNKGDNFQSVLISNAIAEMSSFVGVVHLLKRNVTESVYLGDLLVTAYSTHSRNRTFGTMLGKGYTVKAAQMEMNMVAEGYYGCKCIYAVNQQYGVHMPIARTIYDILYRGVAPEEAIERLSKLFK
ncbi:MAG: NAD(P)H-dependent glycerol-3-phosphate dehydrogenase [Porphyromonas sp.]|nr:NAD(P)H-dependent glycerol-3-phosphate dehydrogenase [Porphyromonas sp.]